MIPGTGPGRGTPWWRRWFLGLYLHRERLGTEPCPRHGRVIAVIGRSDR